MSGDELAWLRIASRMSRSEGEAKSAVTATEFYRWLSFFNMEDERLEKQDNYYARMCFELYHIRYYLMNMKADTATKLDDFFVRLKANVAESSAEGAPRGDLPSEIPEHVRERMELSKAMWVLTYQHFAEQAAKGKK